MFRIKLIATSIFLLLFSTGIFAQSKAQREAKETIEQFKKTDPGISKFFDSAYGYAIFPGIGKGGLIVGAALGKGTVYKEGTPVADVKVKQVTVGFQFGGQKYSEVIFFEDARSYRKFVESEYEFAAQVSAVALQSGVSADAKYRGGIMVFTQTQGGLMYEAAIGGQKFETDLY